MTTRLTRCFMMLLLSVSVEMFSLVGVTAMTPRSLGMEIAAHSTANPKASFTAHAILDYLYQLPSRSEERVIAGQFGSYGDGAGVADAENRLQKIYDQT